MNWREEYVSSSHSACSIGTRTCTYTGVHNELEGGVLYVSSYAVLVHVLAFGAGFAACGQPPLAG